MKRNALKAAGLALLLALAASGAGLAQPQHPRDGRPGHAEMKAYAQANVLPVLRQQRQKLEPQLAAEDRTQLAAYRTQLKVLEAKGKALRQSFRPAGTSAPGQRPELTEAQREQLHQLRSESRSIMLKVAEMAQKYDGAIAKLAEEVQPQREKWTTDLRAIAVKNAAPGQPEQMARFAGREGRGHRGGRHHGFFRPAKFLLMDPNATAAPAEPALGATSFYPNPAAATTQMEYDVRKAGPVTVDLLDKNGNKLRTLFSEAQASTGAHTQQLDLHDLPAGTYFYKITTKSGSENKRFVKE
ncbi:T9SS type A sorting domain-containing protein [Hymenobacter ruricola]|uniref:T9SS type A sorting domain-containing protein n=1 Tax=Hymenobacter ruricola TaxID=2791023 RepID=A0ABS0I4Y6_9BACT|nr:T9SS type A sorting domain-containing protein [Hymenobacter ruricola]MBF9222026.1 T9SS type A sorting domain-containing protein [Hymenobacter ruricola]